MDRLEFWQQVYSDSDDDYHKLIKLLELRGFLFDENQKEYTLSDNSHPDDAEYLSFLLKEYQIGFVERNRINVREASNYYLLEAEFAENKRIMQEACWIYYDWDYFKHRIHGYKAPVKCLEPFIARYVKALSSAGVVLVGSCDGNHRGASKAYLQFGDVASPVWHLLITEELQRRGIDLQWDEKSSLQLKSRTKSKYDTYYDLYNAACFIYDHRFEFRRVKSCALNEYSNSYLQQVKHELISNEFSEKVRRLFRENNLL